MKIREYNEGYDVVIVPIDDFNVKNTPELLGRPVIFARNEGGHNSVQVDLIDVIDWVKENRSDLLK